MNGMHPAVRKANIKHVFVILKCAGNRDFQWDQNKSRHLLGDAQMIQKFTESQFPHIIICLLYSFISKTVCLYKLRGHFNGKYTACKWQCDTTRTTQCFSYIQQSSASCPLKAGGSQKFLVLKKWVGDLKRWGPLTKQNQEHVQI